MIHKMIYDFNQILLFLYFNSCPGDKREKENKSRTDRQTEKGNQKDRQADIDSK